MLGRTVRRCQSVCAPVPRQDRLAGQEPATVFRSRNRFFSLLCLKEARCSDAYRFSKDRNDLWFHLRRKAFRTPRRSGPADDPFHEGVLPLLKVWQNWVSDSLRVEHSNTLNLRTLLCCYGIAREWVELAKEDKAHVVRGMVEKITAFLQESWGLPENEVMSSLLNVDLFARRFASIHASSYMNKEWASVPYVVRQ